MRVRLVARTVLILTASIVAVAPLMLRQAHSDTVCPAGLEPVINTGECAAGPDGIRLVRNKGGKLMDINKCTTYSGREYDEVVFHRNTSPESTAQPLFVTTNDFDWNGVISVIQDDGSIVFTDPAGTRIDTVDTVKKFLATHQDVYDYVAVFPNFNHAEGSFHNHIKNNVQGINVPLQDNSATYNAQFLKSLTLYRNFTLFPADPFARIPGNNDSTMSLLAQEVGHRWAAWVRRDKDPGPRIRAATDLLGRNLAHWCFYLSVPSRLTDPGSPNPPGFSSMEGNFWFDNGDGSFTTTLKSDGYAPVDQYLMGFRSPLAVGTFFKLDPGKGNVTPDCAHAPFTPGVDTPWTFSHPKINVVVDDIVRVEGARVPDQQTSQKNWRMAFIYLHRQGTTTVESELQKLNTYRLAWENYFRDHSNGGRMFTSLGPVDMDLDGFASNLDCDEEDPTVHPGAVEVCNAVDEDCDGLIDEDFDADGDLFTTCGGDCFDDPNSPNANDPNSPSFQGPVPPIQVNPAAAEAWNGWDDNCDTAVDNVNLVDADQDGYFANPQNPSQADCNDANAAVNPGMAEIVNGFDDNCNGFVDCSEAGLPTFQSQSDSGPRGNDGFDNDCNGIIDG